MRERPKEVKRAVVFLYTLAGLRIVVGLFVMVGGIGLGDKGGVLVVMGALALLEGVLLMIAAPNLHRGRGWARVLAIVVFGVDIVGGVISLANGPAQGMGAIAIALLGLVFLLNTRVREWCGGAPAKPSGV